MGGQGGQLQTQVFANQISLSQPLALILAHPALAQKLGGQVLMLGALIARLYKNRDVGDGWVGWSIAHPDFCKSDNLISTIEGSAPQH